MATTTVSLDALRDRAIRAAVAESLKRHPTRTTDIVQAETWIRKDEIQADASGKRQVTIAGLLVTADHCPCPQALTAPEGLCVHRLAYGMQYRTQQWFRQLSEAAPKTAHPDPQPAVESHNGSPAQPDARSQACERAEKLMALAKATIPEKYQLYLMRLSRRTNFGTKDHPNWATLTFPYLTVEGRLKMAREDHGEHHLSIRTSFESYGPTWLARATVTSALRGDAVAHAEVNIGGMGADATNPWSVAETSAIGRALGLLGYGNSGEEGSL